jgi:FlaA1/EpsC-like NDP-sugar epimerase
MFRQFYISRGNEIMKDQALNRPAYMRKRFLCSEIPVLPFQSEAEMADHTLLITGAGGYVGSALTRVLARSRVRNVVLLDSSEDNLFRLCSSIRACRPTARITPVPGSVCDADLVETVFRHFKPQIVFHTAAFKHVGLLEASPFSAVKNNVIGTYTVADAAVRHRCRRLVFCSTDKAASPCSVMGASKRIAELIAISLGGLACIMTAIRLGNVIGSSGSIVPIFLDQISAGRAVTVTHPDVSRYFLSLAETIAALCEGVCSRESGVLLPRFDPPVRIAELAQFLIENHPSPIRKNCFIEFTGLRPGEKLTEDLLSPGETLEHPYEGSLGRVSTATLSPGECQRVVRRLSRIAAADNTRALVDELTSLVPDYSPSAELQKFAQPLPRGRGSEAASEPRTLVSGFCQRLESISS